MSAAVDVLAVMHQDSLGADQYRALYLPERLKERRKESEEARAAVKELIARDEAAGRVFDCILRGINDLSIGTSPLYAIGWLKSWAKTMQATGFRPSNPEARDIANALVLIGGAP